MNEFGSTRHSVTLCCVAGGETYVRYARRLEESFRAYFQAGACNYFCVIPGESGWPDGTLYRWHRLVEKMPSTDYVFVSDADMRFENVVGPEILASHLTLTVHPGYVGRAPGDLPHEKRAESACYVPLEDRTVYFCGAFSGGPNAEMKTFAREIADTIDRDCAQGVTPVWHDESALNRVAIDWPAVHILDPSYCHPDDSARYERDIWKRAYPRKLVALDKKQHERVGRTSHGVSTRLVR